MAKTIPATKFTELKGLDRISQVVHDMKCLFREISKDDFGIDGEIEVVTPKLDGKGFETTGGFIKVQAKSGASFVKNDSAASFTTSVSKNDLEYWNGCTYPVYFIVYHPDDDKLYFKEVRSYVAATANVFQPPLKIVFDKAAQRQCDGVVRFETRLRKVLDQTPIKRSSRRRQTAFRQNAVR